MGRFCYMYINKRVTVYRMNKLHRTIELIHLTLTSWWSQMTEWRVGLVPNTCTKKKCDVNYEYIGREGLENDI